MNVIWVFGGTGMGKRTWIEKHTKPGDTCLGMEPGHYPINREDLKGETVYVRWQWGREELLKELMDDPGYDHRLVLVGVPREKQMEQICQREGYDKYCREVLDDEAAKLGRLYSELYKRNRREVERRFYATQYMDGPNT